MWLVGYWMERGHSPEEILRLSPMERRVWQAVAELNTEAARQETRDAILEAASIIIAQMQK